MWTFITWAWTAGIFPLWLLMHYMILKTNLAPDFIFCQKTCDKTKKRRPGRHGNQDRPWFGDQLRQFLKVNVCNLKTLELIGRPLWTHNTRRTGMCSSRKIVALKKKMLAKRPEKHCKTTLVPGISWVVMFPFRCWSFRRRFPMSLHAHPDFD